MIFLVLALLSTHLVYHLSHRRGGRQTKKKQGRTEKKTGVKFSIVVTMTGKGRELANMIVRRIMCCLCWELNGMEVKLGSLEEVASCFDSKDDH